MADTSPEHNIITNTEGYIYRNINRTRGSDNIINAQELTSIQTQGRSLQRHRTARICRRDVIRQHRNLSNDIIKGTLVVLPLSHPSEEPCLLSLRVYVSCNRALSHKSICPVLLEPPGAISPVVPASGEGPNIQSHIPGQF